MKPTSFGARALACTLLAGTALTAPAHAQTGDASPPSRYQYDANGVDVARGTYGTYVTDLTIGGAGRAGLAYVRPFGQAPGGSNWDLGVFTGASGQVTATIGFTSYLFTQSGTTFTSGDGKGATLTLSGGAYTLTAQDGTVAVYGNAGHDSGDILRLARGTSLTYPTGEKATLTYVEASWCSNNLDGCQNGHTVSGVRLQSVTSALGYQLHFNYGRADNGAMTNTQGIAWRRLDGVTALNMVVDYCDPAAHSCSFSKTWPSVSYSGSAVTDALNRTSYYTATGTGFTIQRAGSSAADVTVALDTSFKVSGVTRDGMSWAYSYGVSGSVATLAVTDPLSHVRTYTSDTDVGLPTAVQNEVGYTSQFVYNADGTLQKAIAPEGNYVEYSYDGRGNVTQTNGVAKSGSGFAPITTSAVYPSCSSGPACNRPTSVTDARGNTTDYTYDSTHGGVLTATLPAPSSGATRPQARYSYTALQAYYRNSAGSIVASGQNAYRLTSVSACQAGSTCAGTADEVRSDIAYGSTGVANNLLPTHVGTHAGDNSLSAATDTAYDDIGNVLSVDGPLSGSADTMAFRYDAARQQVGAISPDPDGSGALHNRAVRTTYNPDGLPTKVEQGIVSGQTDTDWAGFTALQTVDTAYDAAARPIVQWLSAGGTVYGVGQAGYDGEGRPICQVVRMNSADFTTPPTNACAQGTAGGAYGPDRISVTTYDAADRVVAVTSAYGTADQSTDAAYTYTANGLVLTATDAETNATSYDYDGHDRLARTYFPSTTKGAGTSNASDYEQLTYETTAGGTHTSGTVTAFRNRAGETTGFTWDALNRLTARDRPGSNPDDSFGYDLLGRLTAGSSTNGESVASVFDALGNLVSHTETTGSVGRTYAYQYDAAGRRTRLTWPDSFYVSYDRDGTGAMTAMRNPSGTALIAFSYDDAGRRTRIDYGDGSSAVYGYDGVGRLTSLAHDFAGSTNDVTFAMSYNPASQVATRGVSNDAFAWGGHGSGSTSATVDGLNRLSAYGGATPGYDAMGNLTSEGGRALSYDSDNRLSSMSSPQAVGLRYDPLGRLTTLTNGSGPFFIMDRDGTNLVTERGGTGTILARCLFGGEDEPLVQYAGSGTATVSYLHADERGSIVATTDSAGAASRITAYDEYGKSVTSAGRFSFEGKMYLGGIAAYYNNARFYDPKLGRFMQTDPIGYGAGMNLYGYVGGDPVNRIDPRGMSSVGFDDGALGGVGLDPGRIQFRNLGCIDTVQGCKSETGETLPWGYEPVNGSNGHYMRGIDGKIHLTPSRQNEICKSYTALEMSNARVGLGLTGGGAPAFGLNWYAGTVIWIGALTSGVIAVKGPPPGC